jgi:hypothetical protein
MNRELQNGMIGGLLTVGWMAAGYAFHWERSPIGMYAPYLSLLILLVTIYLSVLFKRERDNEGIITLKEAFIAGMTVSFVIGVMVGAFLLVYVQFINPGFAGEMIRNAEVYYKSEHASQEQIDKGVEGMRAMYSPFGQFTYGIGTTMLTGLLISAVIGLVMQRKVRKVVDGR